MTGELRRRSREHERRRALPRRHGPGGPGAVPVEFVKLSPTGNMTLLVRSPHPVADYRPIARELLGTDHVHAEQVGFIRRPTSPGAHARLHMAGDEFCGNACLALAVLRVADHDLGLREPVDVVLEASGASADVVCRVERTESGFHAELGMPLPEVVEPYPLPDGATGRSTLVRYADAVHVVLEAPPHDPATRQHAERLATRLGETEGAAVIAVLLYDPQRGDLAPLVNVPALDRMVWETSCGSGTASVGAHLAATSPGPVHARVRQPGGTMRLHADRSPSGITSLRIGGDVRIVAEGMAYVHV